MKPDSVIEEANNDCFQAKINKVVLQSLAKI